MVQLSSSMVVQQHMRSRKTMEVCYCPSFFFYFIYCAFITSDCPAPCPLVVRFVCFVYLFIYLFACFIVYLHTRHEV